MKRPLVYVVIPLSLGIASSHIFKIPIYYPFIFSAAFIALALIYSKNRLASHINLYLSIFFLGMALYQNSKIVADNHISRFTHEDAKKVFLRGVIADDPVTTRTFYKVDRTSFTFSASCLKDDSIWKKTEGMVKVDSYNTGQKLSFGDELILEGFLSKPIGLRNQGLFDYSKYLEIKGVYSVLKVKEGFLAVILKEGCPDPIKRIAYSLRSSIRGSIESLDAPFNGFLKAILIGDRSGLKERLKEDFIKTGTVHVLSISGLHVGLIAAIFLSLFKILNVPKKPNLLLTMFIMIFYSFLAGSNPPIVRATIMFAIIVVSYLINREADILNSLSFAAILILLYNPKELFNPSFQLSFASIASIVIFAPKMNALFGLGSLTRYSKLNRVRLYITKCASVSIAASLGVAPFVAAYFNIASPIAIAANMVVIPMLFVITVASFLFLFATLVSNIVSSVLGIALCTILKALFSLNHLFAALPFSHFRTPSPSVGIALLYYGLISFIILPKAIEFRKMRISKRGLFVILLIFFNIFVWKEAINFGRDELKATFLDVGQGDSILIELPKRGAILIDGGIGGKDDGFDIGKNVIAPYLWNKGIYRLDAIIATHFHADHLGGIPYIMKNFDVGYALDSGARVLSKSKIYDEYKRVVRERRIKHLVIGEGDEIAVEPFRGVKLFILNPKKGVPLYDSNENSIVVKLVYRGKGILFCGDITDKAIERLASYGGFLKSDVLKVPHHGGFLGDEPIVETFFKKISPKVSIISVGRKNRFKAPLKNTLNVITSLNSTCYKTMDNGAICVVIGENYIKFQPFIK